MHIYIYIEINIFVFRYLSSGNTFTDPHYTYRMGISTISGIVNGVFVVVFGEFYSRSVSPAPSTERLLEVAKKFEERANFPHCIGSVYGKHIRLIKPKDSGSLHFNYR